MDETELPTFVGLDGKKIAVAYYLHASGKEKQVKLVGNRKFVVYVTP